MLLARITVGEGMGLLPAPFSAIRREDMTLAPVAEGALLRVQLGMTGPPGKADAVEACIREALQDSLSCPQPELWAVFFLTV